MGKPRVQHNLQSFDSYRVLDVPISVATLESASAALIRWAGDATGRYVCVRDMHGIMQAQSSAEFKAIHDQAAMVTPDGMPLVWLGRWYGKAVRRTTGSDLMQRAYEDSQVSGLKHYLYGGTAGVAAKLQACLAQRYSNATTVAAETPPFHALTEAELTSLAHRITESGADLVWIGLSTPKQEYLMRRLAPRVAATLIGVGAAFDFHSGAVKRAPLWMQRLGLEWLHRLASQPRRLWRRYLLAGPKFVWMTSVELMRFHFR